MTMIGIARRRMLRYSIALPNGIDAGKGDEWDKGELRKETLE